MATSLSTSYEKDVAPASPSEVAGRPAAAPEGMSWQAVLEQCRKVAKAQSLIAIDCDGLPVAWVGLSETAEAERIAAHVSRAFDLLDRLKYVGRLAECLCSMYWPEGVWLTAVRIAPKVSRVVTIAMIGPYTLVDRGRKRLRNTFVQLLEESWPT